jgi:hypothetical protein
MLAKQKHEEITFKITWNNATLLFWNPNPFKIFCYTNSLPLSTAEVIFTAHMHSFTASLVELDFLPLFQGGKDLYHVYKYLPCMNAN